MKAARVVLAFLLVVGAMVAGIEFVHQQVQQLCRTDRAFIFDLTAPASYPKGAGTPLHAQIDKANAVRKKIHAEAADRYRCN